MKLQKVGELAFILRVAIAVIAGLASYAVTQNIGVAAVLAILGIVVGLLNITEKEVVPFLAAVIALVVSGSSLSVILSGIPQIVMVLQNIVVFAAPAALVVALKAIASLSSSA